MCIMNKTFKPVKIWSFVWRYGIIFFLFTVLSNLLFLYLDHTHDIAVMDLPLFSAVNGFIIFFLAFLVIHYLFKKKFNISWKGVIGSLKINPKQLLICTGLTIPVIVFGWTLTYPVFWVATEFFQTMIEQHYDRILLFLQNMNSFGSPLETFITAAILAPIFEEILFRGYFVNKLADNRKLSTGIILSALVFMIIHIPSLFFPQLMLGLLTAVVYTRTKQLIYPIYVHALYNFVIILPNLIGIGNDRDMSAFLRPSESMQSNFLIGTIICGVFLIICLVSMIRYSKGINQEHTPYVENMSTTETASNQL